MRLQLGQENRTGREPVHMIMQRGAFTHLRTTEDFGIFEGSTEPFLSRPVVVEATNTDTTLEAILRRLPFPFENVAVMTSQYADQYEAVYFLICEDRASPNLNLAGYLARFTHERLPRHSVV